MDKKIIKIILLLVTTTTVSSCYQYQAPRLPLEGNEGMFAREVGQTIEIFKGGELEKILPK